MATGAKIGHGSIFAWGNGATPEIFVPFGEVTAITGPSIVRDTVDATHMGSPEKWREFIPGLRDAGEISLTLNFIAGGVAQDVVFQKFASDVPSNFQVTWAGGETWWFSAYCTSHEVEAPLDDTMTATVAFKLTGKPAFFLVTATGLAANRLAQQAADEAAADAVARVGSND